MNSEVGPHKRCPGCGVAPGERHRDGCDVSLCPECGQQAIQCEDHPDAGMQIWTGRWPGEVECQEYNVNLHGLRIMAAKGQAVWDREAQRFRATSMIPCPLDGEPLRKVERWPGFIRYTHRDGYVHRGFFERLTVDESHRCDESCACPADGKSMWYSPHFHEHACVDPTCVYALGSNMVTVPLRVTDHAVMKKLRSDTLSHISIDLERPEECPQRPFRLAEQAHELLRSSEASAEVPPAFSSFSSNVSMTGPTTSEEVNGDEESTEELPSGGQTQSGEGTGSPE